MTKKDILQRKKEMFDEESCYFEYLECNICRVKGNQMLLDVAERWNICLSCGIGDGDD